MARPIESPSGLARVHLTTRVDLVLMSFAKANGFEFSKAIEQSIMKQYGFKRGKAPVEVVRHLASLIIKPHDVYEERKDLDDASVEWEGETIESLADSLSFKALPEYMASYQSKAEDFDQEDIIKEWPLTGPLPEACRLFYCKEIDTFGVVVLTRAAWEALP